jgi:cysteine-rich repeat protein
VSQVKLRLASAARLYVCAQTANATEFIIWRIQTDGSIDPSWNLGAPLIVTSQWLASSSFSPTFDVVVESSDSLFLVGAKHSSSSIAAFVIKLTPFGTLDNSFGAVGVASYMTDASSAGLQSATYGLPSSPTYMYLAGWRANGNSTSAIVVKISAVSGELDLSFGQQGSATVITAPASAELSIGHMLYDPNSSSIAAFGIASTPKAATGAFLARLDPIFGSLSCIGPTPVSWLHDISNIVGAVAIGGSYVVATDVGTTIRLTSFSSLGQQFCSPMCGNAILEAFEECDDGNRFGGDGCSATCRVEPSG